MENKIEKFTSKLNTKILKIDFNLKICNKFAKSHLKEKKNIILEIKKLIKQF